MPINRATDKKKALLAYKQKILNDIKYYEKRINDDLNNLSTAPIDVNFEDSSESEDECPFKIDTGPTVHDLKCQEKALRTDLQATQELASLAVLQSRVDIMLEDPVLNGERPVTQPGVWREVNADCRIDCVPFSTTFYVHQAKGIFGAKSYRGLKVVPVKPAQEIELAKSVLTRVVTPSDALEVLRSYSVAFRSRRTTLSKLATRFGNNLFMEAMPAGGYVLKCANLLEVSWVLQNKWSPVAPFYHKMIFDLENMDECFIKIIRHAHKQLGDPSTDTDQRTLLLAKIITTCLEARGTQDLSESMESDAESVKNIEKRRLTFENEAPEPKKRRNDNNNDEIDDGNTGDNVNNRDDVDQLMAPPKSLPKKVKPKGKENTDQNRKSVKRATVENEGSNAKKARTDKNDQNKPRQSDSERNKAVENDNQNKDKDIAKNKDKVAESQINTEKDKTKNKDKAAKTQNNSEKSVKDTEKEQPKANKAKSDHNHNGDNADNVKSKEKGAKTQNTKEKVPINQNNEKAKNNQKAKVVKSKAREEKSSAKDKNETNKENVENVLENVNVQDKPKKKVSKNAESQKESNNDKVVASSKNNPSTKNPESQKASTKNKVTASSNDIPNENNPKSKNSETQKASNKDNIASSKNDPKSKEADKVNEPSKKQSKTVHSPINNQITTHNTQHGNTEHNAKNGNSNAKHGNTNAKLVEIDELPIFTVNNNIDTVPKNDNNHKTANNQKGVSKNTNANEKGQKKENKLLNNKPINMNKETKNKETNAKKTTANNEVKSNTKPTNNAASKNDKHSQKNSASDAETLQNKKASKNPENNPKEVQKSNAQKSKPTQKDSAKNTTEVVKNNEKNTENQETAKEVTENDQRPKAVITEKAAKHPNVATKNNEQTNIANTKKTTKTFEKPKLAIKTLTHKTVAASKKVGENLITSSKNKIKTGNIAKHFKKPTVTESDSASKATKIPMKLSIHESLKKKNPLRISPRKLLSTFKCPTESNMKQKNIFTNIPRLLKKPDAKKISK